MTITKRKFKTTGMTCTSCEKIIAKQVLKNPGVKSIDINYVTEKATVKFDDTRTSYQEIKKQIEKKGYHCQDPDFKDKKQLFGWAFGIIGVLIVGYYLLKLFDSIQLPQISQNMGYGLLFIVGLLTGFHCISMCGGFVVSYTTKGVKSGKPAHKLHLSYGIGKTLSYTIIGAVFGLLGSLIAFTPTMRGVAGILAGLFLLVFGLRMLNVIPALRKFKLTMPNFINKFTDKKSKKYASSPLAIGLLNGLMIACGPLQAIYIMAAGTGSALEGAKLLFIFALGTLPVMLGFGYITSYISAKSTNKILKASAVIVIILGLIMVNRGLALTGTGYDFNSLSTNFNYLSGTSNTLDSTISGTTFENGYQIIKMEVNRYGWTPEKFILKKGVPVKWVIEGKEITGCNNAIQVPKLGLKFDIKKGTQTIEFTPKETGTISWSCWMGMIPGVFVVKDQVTGAPQELTTVQVPKGGSCGGGCGCGG